MNTVMLLSNFLSMVNQTNSQYLDWQTGLPIILSAITVVITGIALFLQQINHKKQLQANIIATARVQWMKEVRGIYSTFIKLSADYHNELLFFKDSKENSKDCKEKSFNELRGHFWACYYQLISYFPENDKEGKNGELVDIFEELVIFLEDKLEYSYSDPTFSEFKPQNEELQEFDISEQYNVMLHRISEKFSLYLKMEWEKAKGEVTK